MHPKCANVSLSLMIDNPLNKYFVLDHKTVIDLKREFLIKGENSDEIVRNKLNQLKIKTLYHICSPCLKQSRIQKIKTWTKIKVLFHLVRTLL